MDLVPGIVTYFWMTPTEHGKYDILCAELCGIGHHEMRGTVVVEQAGDFDSWLAQQPSFGQALASAKPGGFSSRRPIAARRPSGGTLMATHSLTI